MTKNSINKLKSLVDSILICLFCIDLQIDDWFTWQTMLIIKVCDQVNIGLFSENSSDKNKAIVADKNVQLFFAHPAKIIYLVLNG